MESPHSLRRHSGEFIKATQLSPLPSKTSEPPRISKSELTYVQNAVDDLNQSIDTLSAKIQPGKRKKKHVGSIFTFNISHWRFIHAARGARNYCRQVSDYYEQIDAELQFPVFPERCGRLTHLSAQIWILTFALNEISWELVQEKDFESINKAFAMLITEGDLTEGVLNEFTTQLLSSTSAAMDTLKISTEKLEARYEESKTHQRQSAARLERSVKHLLLAGSKINDDGLFHTIRLYMRTAGKRKWFRFVVFGLGNSLKVITDGLAEAAATLKTIRGQIIALNKYLERDNVCCHTTIETSTTKMAAALDSMLENRNGSFSESIFRVGNTIRKSAAVIYSIQLNGRKLALQILEAQAMTRLCCKFIVEHLDIPLKAYSDTTTTAGPDVKEASPVVVEGGGGENNESEFTSEDFFKTGYPDVLRKVPVIINQNELSLHKFLGERESEIELPPPSPPS